MDVEEQLEPHSTRSNMVIHSNATPVVVSDSSIPSPAKGKVIDLFNERMSSMLKEI